MVPRKMRSERGTAGQKEENGCEYFVACGVQKNLGALQVKNRGADEWNEYHVGGIVLRKRQSDESTHRILEQQA